MDIPKWHDIVTVSLDEASRKHKALVKGQKWNSFSFTMKQGDSTHRSMFADHTQLIFIASGRYRIEQYGETYIASPLDIIVIENGQHHVIDCIESGVFTCTFIDHR